MKNIQVIDGAANCAYAIYALEDDEFQIVFPGVKQNVEFIEDLVERLGDAKVGRLLAPAWARQVAKPDVQGIHGTLFYQLYWKKKYYPTKNDEEMTVPF